MLKVMELFCGAGSFSVNMGSNGIEHDVVAFSDIRETAIDLFCKIHDKKPEENLGDIKNVSGVGVDVDLLVFGSPCFVAGTKIFTNKGYKSIEDVKVGDMVLTHEKRFRKVLRTGGELKDTILVYAQGIKTTETTYNHPYYIRDGMNEPEWMEAGNLEEGVYLGIPFQLVDSDYEIKNNEYVLNDILWTPFTYIEETGEVKQVYNLEVEEDNSYTANNAIVHNCQSFSRTGKSEGGKKGSNTKSSLMWEAVRIMSECKPKYIVWENVPDAVSKKHFENFNEYMLELDEMGYNTYYKVLNAHELGSAQKRKRLFAVSIRKDVDDGNFKFIENKILPKKLSSYLESDVADIFNVEEKIANNLIIKKDGKDLYIKNATKQGYLIATDGDAVDTGFPNSQTRRGRVQKEACQTLLRSKTISVVDNGRLRYLTPREVWRLQEMPDDLFDKVIDCNMSLNDQYDVVGGVINQKHLDVVFNSLKPYFNRSMTGGI